MTKSFENYTLLAGNHGRRGSLWQGPDHLLVVEGGGVLFAYSESYRRIDYANIQALTLARTSRYAWLIAAFSVPVAVAALILFAMWASDANRAFLVGFGTVMSIPFILVPLTLLIIHLVKGRTVRCSLQTAVQNLRLRPLTREAKSQRVLDTLTQLCRQHQGDAPLPDAAVLPMQPAPMVPQPGMKPLWHGSPAVPAAGLAMLLWGLALTGELFIGGMGFLMLDFFLCLIATAAAVVALVIAMRHQSPGGLLAALWIAPATGLLCGFLSLFAFGFAVASLERQGGASDPGAVFTRLADLSLADTYGFGWVIVGLGVLSVVLGLVMLPHGPRKRAPAAASPAMPPAFTNTNPPS